MFETRAGAQGLTGSKTMKWALVPDVAGGSYTIPPIYHQLFRPRGGDVSDQGNAGTGFEGFA